jgi:hypothetical protein
MIKATAAIIAPKIKGVPGPIYFQNNPAISEKKVMMPIRVW